ncbi:bifunctional indole-3-glycerol-phosphate synthase TrpC/phosphoribosylanthranilate isomerase TrpF [uncultured Succinatimonas sp.]|uniref:bifunctional indole-3-glycerol-phosphate synthase TrpC/phosphoribosylanthranilate isomerase TrpF n=1 Tax=uncultured Succinatimonas sp. TaxID=1262973 RepID=UPI0025D7526A|nr:bifunctional indole-3-glycerol-phosphate synthase TrpC/phosphoribosylanthranilate isomerase TrpF [uncultured Succinatimonas sp.]
MLQAQKLSAAALKYDGLNIESLDNTVLAAIINKKVENIAAIKEYNASLSDNTCVKRKPHEFKRAFEGNRRHFILECKKSSPSLGDFCPDFNLEKIVSCYNDRADAISVLTEEFFFKGSFEYLKQVRKLTEKPLLCKDFIIAKEQIEIAKKIGSDAVLLMLSVLTFDKFLELYEFAKTLNLDVLTEVSNEVEAKFAIEHHIDIVGINNRDLRTLKIDLSNAKKLYPLFPDSTVVISESGIKTHRDIVNMLPLKNFLIGSALCSEIDIDIKANTLLYGFNKLCGLTDKEGIETAINNKFSLAGLIFAEKSPRCINLEQAAKLALNPIYKSKINFCGVFKDAEINSVIEIASKLCLKFVQLHGKESPDYIKTLHEKCPQLTIIKALGMNESLSHEDLVLFKEYAATADYLLLDSKNPGSGKEFDKSLIPDFINKDKTIISGGIGPSNIASILTLNFCGVDCNSCLESAPGKKDPVLVRELFNRINEIKE